jgi:hypothetical protein
MQAKTHKRSRGSKSGSPFHKKPKWHSWCDAGGWLYGTPGGEEALAAWMDGRGIKLRCCPENTMEARYGRTQSFPGP